MVRRRRASIDSIIERLLKLVFSIFVSIISVIIKLACDGISKIFDFNIGSNKKQIEPRRPPFKKLYELNQVQPINEFEDKMVKGMFSENKEVFVTAFTNEAHVLRVTATIGSKHRCRASDNMNLWGIKSKKIGATKIRHYHNHPDVFGRSFPSQTDKVTHRELKLFVEQWDVGFKSFLVYRTWLGDTKIKEYK